MMGGRAVLQFLLVLLVGSKTIDALFTRTNISMMGSGNISCNLLADLYALLPYQSNTGGLNGIVNVTQIPNNEFCFIQLRNVTLRNGTTVSTAFSSVLNHYNIFKEYVSSRCSSGQFWPSVTPIGYGTCARLPFETQTVQLCICSTNNCNADYSTCVASVQATQSAPPPNLPTYYPDLTSLITCHQGYQGSTYSDMYHGTGWLFNAYTPFNISEFHAYRSSHAVACLLYVNAQTGDWYQFPATYEEYGTHLYAILVEKSLNMLSSYAESSTSVSVQHSAMYYTNSASFWNPNYFTEIICICTTNNCNPDVLTCITGFKTNVTMATTARPNSTNQTTTTAPTTTSTKKCFPATARVCRDDGAILLMSDVRIGDLLLVADGTYSPVWTFLVHQQQGSFIDYLRISTNRSTLQITRSHLILMHRQGHTGPPRYLQASRLRPGDHIFLLRADANETRQETEVVEVIDTVKRSDAYAPLTEAGTLVVDDVIVSCYGAYEHHSLIHAAMQPFRMWNKMKSYLVVSDEWKNDVGGYVEGWLGVSRYLDLAIHTV